MYGWDYAVGIGIIALALMGLVQVAGTSLANLYQHLWVSLSGLR